MTKMTKKDILTGIMDGTLDRDAIVAFCEKEIASLDAKALKAKERAAKKRAEGDELQAVVESLLTDEPQTREQIAAQIEGEDVSVAKVGYRLSNLVKIGKAVKSDVIVPDDNGKNRKLAGYAIA